jgi:hypothetical protein
MPSPVLDLGSNLEENLKRWVERPQGSRSQVCRLGSHLFRETEMVDRQRNLRKTEGKNLPQARRRRWQEIAR